LTTIDDDEGILELWCEWLKEHYRQDYDKIVAQYEEILNSYNKKRIYGM